jgi:hypothetical protein
MQTFRFVRYGPPAILVAAPTYFDARDFAVRAFGDAEGVRLEPIATIVPADLAPHLWHVALEWIGTDAGDRPNRHMVARVRHQSDEMSVDEAVSWVRSRLAENPLDGDRPDLVEAHRRGD